MSGNKFLRHLIFYTLHYYIYIYEKPHLIGSRKEQRKQIKPYNDKEEKGAQVEQMFDNIAHSYDKLNHRLSWNIDKLWRKRALNRLKPYKPQSILDIATGTGDFAIQAAQTLQPKQVTGTDISEGMMNVGRRDIVRQGRLHGALVRRQHVRRRNCGVRHS